MKAFVNQHLDRAVTAVVRFRRRIAATVAQGQEFLRACRQLLEIISSRKTTFRFVAAGLHRRIDALLHHGGELVVRTVRQRFGNLSPRKTTLIFVAAGLIGLALILLLLEISLRMELAREASDAAIGVIPPPSAGPQRLEFGDVFPIQPTTPTSLQSVHQLGAPAATPSSDYAQTFGQVSREPVPFPRPRKPR